MGGFKPIFFPEQNRDVKTTKLGAGLLTKADSLVFRSDIAQITDSLTSKKKKVGGSIIVVYPPKADCAPHEDQGTTGQNMWGRDRKSA